MTHRVDRVAGLLLALLAGGAWAHHSGAMFDRDRILTLQGTIKAYEFTNPHTWVRLMVESPDGQFREWDVEGAAPARMSSWGITPDRVKSGDRVKVRMHPLKDGRPGGILIDIAYPDGTVLGTPTDQR